jgi:phytoene desaturase
LSKKIIIIGGGLAGLSAGCYAAMNGYEPQIFEHYSVPGGVAAAWKRGGYLIDGGIHFMMGYKPGTGMFGLLNELGAADPSLYTDMGDYGKFIHEPAGLSLTMSGDINELAVRLKNLAPPDTAKIDELFKGARAMRGRDLSTVGMSIPPELASLKSRASEMWQMLPFAKYFTGRYARTMIEFTKDVQTPWLKDFFCNLFMPESPVWFVMMVLAIVAEKQTSYLTRGCLSLATAIEKRYKTLGGKITYNATVNKVLVENGSSGGVRLDDDREFMADFIISCGDSYNTIFNLLEGKYLNVKIKERHEKWKAYRPFLTVSYGVTREFKNEVPFITILLDKPVIIGDEPVKTLLFRIFNYSGHFAPAGKSVFQIELETGFDYWFNLQMKDRLAYDEAKQKVAEELLLCAERYYPGISGHVEVTDVSTPYTTWRYTMNNRGSWGGWMMSADYILQQVERRLPGLNNFYMAGHWILGGVPGVLLSGRHAVQLICHDDRRKFVAIKA